MAKKSKAEEKAVETPATPTESFRIVNLKESIQSVPVFDENGETSYLHLRLQGRNGQKPPVIESWQITEQLKGLERRGFIRIEKI